MKVPRRLTVAVLMAAVCAAAGAVPAEGATYTVESCNNGSSSGWAPFYSGAYSGWGNSCGVAGGALHAAISSGAGSTAGWTFTAPADTTIAGFLMTAAGHVLKPGEVVNYNGLTFRVERVERRRVMRVRLELSKTEESGTTTTAAGARAAG